MSAADLPSRDGLCQHQPQEVTIDTSSARIMKAAAACLLASVVCAAGTGSSAWAATGSDIVVSRIFDDGRLVDVVDGPLKVELRSPSGALTTRLEKGQVLPPQTQLAPRAGVLVELARAEPRLQVRVEPRTRLTIVRTDANGAALDVGEGQASFTLSGRLNFFFGVSAYKRVLALARGTRFTVDARGGCGGRADAPCVQVQLDEGRLDLETRRPLQLSATGPLPAATLDEDATVLVVDALVAGDRRALPLEPEQFALRFDSPQAADAHYSRDLQQARAAGDPAAVLRALRNLLVVRRLADRHDAALALADEGLQLAQREGDRLWTFRFLIDKGFIAWRLQRNRAALEPFERAFAMHDVVQDAGARTDLAALYTRYGNIRFDARDRNQPQADLAIAQDFLQRGLALREAAAGPVPTLDLSMSHYALGMLLRIGRDDAVQSSLHLQRAVQIRRQVLGDRDDVSSAEMMAEAALTAERVASEGRPACLAGGGGGGADPAAPFHTARRLFEDSLAMLQRLSPDPPYRSYAAVARRSADQRRRAGDWLLAGCRADAAAQAEFIAARADYQRSLAAWARQPGNTLTERRFAWRGLGLAALQLRAWAQAEEALQQALALALDDRCSTPPGPEAPSFGWIGDVLDGLAQAADGGGQAEAAAAYRRRRADVESACRPAGGALPQR